MSLLTVLLLSGALIFITGLSAYFEEKRESKRNSRNRKTLQLGHSQPHRRRPFLSLAKSEEPDSDGASKAGGGGEEGRGQ
jgi:hypothetical protein